MTRVHGLSCAALIVAALVPACSSGTRTSDVVQRRTFEYRPGLALDIRIPPGARPDAPVLVLVPGGAWRSADPAGLDPLAGRLAEAGFASATITLRLPVDGVAFPQPVGDVLCAVASVAEQVEAAGISGPMVIVGHSSGAHLAALAALAADRFADPTCPHRSRAPDALVGLAGIYDLTLVPDVARALMGTSRDDDLARWTEASPCSWVSERLPLPALLAHGDADELVPLAFSETFAEQLSTAGHTVSLRVLPGVDHHSIYAADVIRPTLQEWLQTLGETHRGE